MTNNAPDYKWRPIEPLHANDARINYSDVAAMALAFQGFWRKDDKSRRYRAEVIRRWSIETGLLERLYDLDRGTTKILVERGFVQDYIERSSTNISPDRLIAILDDHQGAAELVMNGVGGKRELTKGLIKEIHSALTAHQDDVEAQDASGRIVSIPLERGIFKTRPNNPTRPDGLLHEYCPPIQVDSEIEKMLEWYREYCGREALVRDVKEEMTLSSLKREAGEIDPLVVAAWLHHRFTRIHPFQDGNGRVARTLVLFHLVSRGYLPVVVRRVDRERYISALEDADNSDSVRCLTELFASLEENQLMRILSELPRTAEVSADLSGESGTKVEAATAQVLASRRRRKSIARDDSPDPPAIKWLLSMCLELLRNHLTVARDTLANDAYFQDLKMAPIDLREVTDDSAINYTDTGTYTFGGMLEHFQWNSTAREIPFYLQDDDEQKVAFTIRNLYEVSDGRISHVCSGLWLNDQQDPNWSSLDFSVEWVLVRMPVNEGSMPIFIGATLAAADYDERSGDFSDDLPLSTSSSLLIVPGELREPTPELRKKIDNWLDGELARAVELWARRLG